MGSSAASEYRARAEECSRRAKRAKGKTAKADWLQLAKSWQVLAENVEKQQVYEIVRPFPSAPQ
jgi:hypothetical protein